MVTMDDIKTPPQNLEAEKGVLAWALMDNETIWIYDADKLEPADFYQKEHQDNENVERCKHGFLSERASGNLFCDKKIVVRT